jgi:hypothetical protein
MLASEWIYQLGVVTRQLVIFMRIWQYIYFMVQASERNVVQLGPRGRSCVKLTYSRHGGRWCAHII